MKHNADIGLFTKPSTVGNDGYPAEEGVILLKADKDRQTQPVSPFEENHRCCPTVIVTHRPSSRKVNRLYKKKQNEIGCMGREPQHQIHFAMRNTSLDHPNGTGIFSIHNQFDLPYKVLTICSY
jgi:hypothetical protein